MAPRGRAEVSDALVQATIELIVEKGLAISVREIAAHAGVNHGLVHVYFGSKDALVRAAFDEINRRAAAELNPDGSVPLDLVVRHDAELARAFARAALDGGADPASSHPVLTSLVATLRRERPDATDADVVVAAAARAALALGWGVFAGLLLDALDVPADNHDAVSTRVLELAASIDAAPPG